MMAATGPQNLPTGYASLGYIDVKHPVQIPATAGPFDIVASITVPVGQYWIPKAVRVSLIATGIGIGGAGIKSSVFAGPPTAQLFLGAPQVEGAFKTATHPIVNANLGLYLDGTVRGDDDITGVLSGMTLAPGNALTMVWHNVLPPVDASNNPVQGGTAVMEVIGGWSNVPVEANEGLLPETMGPQFRGKPGIATPDNAFSNAPFAADAPGAGNTVVLVNNLPPYMKLFTLQWCWSNAEPTTGQVSGRFAIQQTSPLATTNITFDVAQPSGKLLPLAGLTSSTPGVGATRLVFIEDPASGILVNTSVLAGTLVYTDTDAIQLP